MKFINKFALAALFVAGMACVQRAGAEDGAVRIGVANPSKILQQMQETQEKNKAMQAEQVTLNAEEKKRLEEIKDLGEQREKFSKKGTPEYNEKSNQILAKRVDLQVWGELKKAELTRRHKEDIKALFGKIQQTIGQVAQEKKIDLVITDFGVDLPEDTDTVTPENLHAMIGQKNILYTNKGVDISAEVTARLDAAYKK